MPYVSDENNTTRRDLMQVTRHDAMQYNKYRVAFVASLGNPVSFTLHFLEPDDSKEKKEDDIK